MKITKEGTSIVVPFHCKLCGCTYECDILECSFEQSTVLGIDIIKAIHGDILECSFEQSTVLGIDIIKPVHECPWCKLTNKTDSDYFKTPNGKYLKIAYR